MSTTLYLKWFSGLPIQAANLLLKIKKAIAKWTLITTSKARILHNLFKRWLIY